MKDQDCIAKTKGNIIKATESKNTVVPHLNNGFVAYNKHLNWEISPDDVWVAIMTAFATYVDKHAETMRPLFVAHEDQLLTCFDDEFEQFVRNYFDQVVQAHE